MSNATNNCATTTFLSVMGWLLLSLLLALVGARSSYDTNNFPQVDPDRYIVQFVGDAELAKATIQKLGGGILVDLPSINAAAVSLSPEIFQKVKNSDFVKFIEHDVPRWPMAGSMSGSIPQVTPYGIGQVESNITSQGPQQSWVCIVDSGINAAHEDLQCLSGLRGTPAGWDTDNCGHGTHVAGTVAACDNEIGVLGVLNPSIYVVKVFGDNCGWSYASNLISAVTYCISDSGNLNQPTRTQVVVSMSLGCSAALDAQCRSNAEDTFFQNVWNQGHISVAAAGNAGNTQNSWPASYAAVISVAANDANYNYAAFSQRNTYVEISAPGVNVESTVPMGHGEKTSFSIETNTYTVEGLDGSPYGNATGPIVDCGVGAVNCTAARNGGICLLQRGEGISFSDKVLRCQWGGGSAALIYNNVAGIFLGTLNGVATDIPSASLSMEDGTAILAAHQGDSGKFALIVDNYDFYDGTSMSTPHVSGVLAKVWSHNKSWTNAQLRSTMQNTARYLNGQTGKNNNSGFGLIQAQKMLTSLQNLH